MKIHTYNKYYEHDLVWLVAMNTI